MTLEVDKAIDIVSFRESGDEMISVLVNPSSEIARYARVENARSTGKDVDVVGVHPTNSLEQIPVERDRTSAGGVVRVRKSAISTVDSDPSLRSG